MKHFISRPNTDPPIDLFSPMTWDDDPQIHKGSLSDVTAVVGKESKRAEGVDPLNPQGTQQGPDVSSLQHQHASAQAIMHRAASSAAYHQTNNNVEDYNKHAAKYKAAAGHVKFLEGRGITSNKQHHQDMIEHYKANQGQYEGESVNARQRARWHAQTLGTGGYTPMEPPSKPREEQGSGTRTYKRTPPKPEGEGEGLSEEIFSGKMDRPAQARGEIKMKRKRSPEGWRAPSRGYQDKTMVRRVRTAKPPKKYPAAEIFAGKMKRPKGKVVPEVAEKSLHALMGPALFVRI